MQRQTQKIASNYFKAFQEDGGMLKFPLNTEGDHSRTTGALFLHHFILGVRGQACVEREKHEKATVKENMSGPECFFCE